MAYMADLVGVEFYVPCAGQRTFCALCLDAVCERCCPAHVASAHGVLGGPRRTIAVSLLEGQFPAVTAVSLRHGGGGLGYNWQRIQRVDHQGTAYVMLGREQPEWERSRQRMKGRCRPCHDNIETKWDHCSPACKLAHVHTGQSRAIIQALVDCNFTQTHLLDRFCTSCRRAFSSHHCANHAHHHPAGEEFQVLTILRQDGWVLIPVQELPAVWVESVKRLVTAEGVETVAVRERLTPDRNGEPRVCLRCQEGVPHADRFCSLRCKGR